MRRYIIPSVKESAQASRRCPYCDSMRGHIHQTRSHSLVDTRLGRVRKLRLQCSSCQRTWTSQPEGVKAHFQRSQRVRALNVLLYALGLSYAAVAQVLTALGAPESKASSYRDLVDSYDKAKQLHKRGKRKVRLAGIDGTGQRLAQPHNAHSESLLFVVDFSDGALLEVELLDEDDACAVAALVKDLQAKYSIELFVTDEHKSYSQAIPAQKHLLCTTHFKKNKLRRVRELKGEAKSENMKRDLDELEKLLKEVPEDGQQRAKAVYRRQRRVKRPKKGKRASAASRLKALAGEIYEKWERVWQQTNNQTERAIGECLKIRSKTMRGFKVKKNIVGFVKLTSWVRQSEKVSLGELF